MPARNTIRGFGRNEDNAGPRAEEKREETAIRTLTTVLLFCAAIYGCVWVWQAWQSGNWYTPPGLGESGGQVGDKGRLSSENTEISVLNTKKICLHLLPDFLFIVI